MNGDHTNTIVTGPHPLRCTFDDRSGKELDIGNVVTVVATHPIGTVPVPIPLALRDNVARRHGWPAAS